MSKIAIVIPQTSDLMRTIAVLRRAVPETSIADLRQRLAAGTPAVEALLFQNDYAQVAERLRELINELPKTGAQVRFFELDPAEQFDKEADLSRREITADTLLNILGSAKSYE